MLQISAEALYEIEQALSEPLFRGFPIGQTMGNALGTQLYTGNGKWDYKSVWKNRLRCVYHRLMNSTGREYIREEYEKLSSFNGRVVLTWFSEKPHFRDLVLPALKAIGGERCFVLGKSTTMRSYLPPETGFLTFSGIPGISIKQWRNDFKGLMPLLQRRLATVLKKHDIPGYVVPFITDTIITQSQLLLAFDQMLDVFKPSAILTEHDRNGITSCLVLPATARGIPTMTMLHGVINGPGYTPILSDVAFCWGEHHKSKMMELGTELERLVITGCQGIDRTVTSRTDEAKRRGGFPPEKPLVLLATNPIAPPHRKKLAQIFCEGITRNDLVSAGVRLHPQEKLEFYREEIERFPTVRFLENRVWSHDEALAATDMAVCHHSGFGNEVLVAGKLTLIMDVLPSNLGNGEELIRRAGCPHIMSAEELSETVKRILSDSAYANKLSARAERYVHDFCAYFGEDAAARVAREVLERAHQPGS